jgi:hypothetical protein
MLVKCEYCGIEFEKSQAEINRTKNHYCSKQCFKNANFNSVTVICEQCGKEFLKTKANYERDNHHFCSNTCKFKYKNKQIEVECEVCGKIHCKKQDEYMKTQHHYCSKKCMYEGQKKRVKKICEYCGKTFEVPKSSENKRVYCSIECKSEATKQMETDSRKYIKCDNCGIEFMRYNYRADNNKYNFCSYECMGEFRRNDEYSEDYYDSKEWKELRLLALLRDKQKCCECGTNDAKLIVHHKVPRRKGGKDEISNLITLCNTCHIKTHLKDLQEGSEEVKLRNYYKKMLKRSAQ